ncbi:Peptidyl-prolyl cis-trans isomerase FKBP16-1, chloroplastic [Linum perenne]
MFIMNSLYSNFQLCHSSLVHPPRYADLPLLIHSSPSSNSGNLSASNSLRARKPNRAFFTRGFASIPMTFVPRRLVLGLITHLSILNPAFAVVSSKQMDEPIETLKLDNGVRIQEVIEGEGPEAGEGDVVEINYVCRRSNGYFVHSTVDQFNGESSPVKLALNENQIIKGLKDVLVGMKVGGKRRALIPPSVGYVNESLKPIPEEFGPRRSLLSHAKEPLIFEVQLLKVL